MCQAFSIHPSGYYYWLKSPGSPRKRENQRIEKRISELYREHRGMAGSPMITADLRAEPGFSKVSKNRVARHMRKLGLRCQATKKFVVTTDSNHNEPIAPNLLNREFTVKTPNKVWVSDITYLKVGRKWHYLTVFMDLYSRIIVGWNLSHTLDRYSTIHAFTKAQMRRKPGKGLIHSDQGVQYASGDFRRLLRNNGCLQSMSRKGNCWDTQFIIPMNVKLA